MKNPQFIKEIKKKFGKVILDFKSYNDEIILTIDKTSLLPLAKELKKIGFEYFSFVTAVDYQERIILVYRLSSFKDKVNLILKAILPLSDLKIDSVSSIWGGANWHEREVFDLFGVVFDHHPDLRRILLPENWSGHPLRKDYRDEDVVKRKEYF